MSAISDTILNGGEFIKRSEKERDEREGEREREKKGRKRAIESKMDILHEEIGKFCTLLP